MNEKSLLAFLQYNALCQAAYEQKLHQHPDVRAIESEYYRKFMDSLRAQKLGDIN